MPLLRVADDELHLWTLRPPPPGSAAADALVLLAEGSRAHDAREVAQRAKALGLRTDTVPGATHHTLPATLPPRALEVLTAFLTP